MMTVGERFGQRTTLGALRLFCVKIVTITTTTLARLVGELSIMMIARVLFLVEAFWNEFLNFSRRTPQQLERWAARYGRKDSPQEVLNHAKGDNIGRYTCVNLKNYATIEFRIFRGTLKLNTLMATLEMVEHICNICQYSTDENLKKLSWSDFVTRINEKVNPELVQYLKERRLYVNEPKENTLAFAHNGVLYNDVQLRKSENLPKTHIETDSYVAVQLLEKEETVHQDSLKHMAELVDGSFVFTVLDEEDSIYFVKGENPLTIFHYKKMRLYVYASTSFKKKSSSSHKKKPSTPAPPPGNLC